MEAGFLAECGTNPLYISQSQKKRGGGHPSVSLMSPTRTPISLSPNQQALRPTKRRRVNLGQFQAPAPVGRLGNHAPLPEEIADRGDNFPLIARIGGDRGDKIAE